MDAATVEPETDEAADPLAERAAVREALLALEEAAPDLGVPAGESAAWRAAASGLANPIAIMLAGADGAGKTALAEALGGAPLDPEEERVEDSGGLFGGAAREPAVQLWQYGFERADLASGPLVERYRPAPPLRRFTFVEASPAAFDGDPAPAERAYAMADVVLLVFSADDPWGRVGWEFLRRIHRRRERPVAAVVTHADGRTAEEIGALIDYLQKTSRAAIGEEVPVFRSASLSALREGGLPELAAWAVGEACARPAAQARMARAENALEAAAKRVAGELVGSVEITDEEAECVSWAQAEVERETAAAEAEAAGALAPAREMFQDLTSASRRRLAAAVGAFGIFWAPLRGARWLTKAAGAAAAATARAAGEGGRQAAEAADRRLAGLAERIRARTAEVFGESFAEQLPEPPPLDAGEAFARRAAARVAEATGGDEAGAAPAAKLGAWRVLALLALAVIGVAFGAAAWLHIGRGQTGTALLLAGVGLSLVLWSAVLLRARGKAVLEAFDRESGAAREALGRGLARVCAPPVESAFADYREGLAPLRERAGDLARDRADLRARVLQAIELAAERREAAAVE